MNVTVIVTVIVYVEIIPDFQGFVNKFLSFSGAAQEDVRSLAVFWPV